MRYEIEKTKLLKIIPKSLQEAFESHFCIIAGGAITSIFTNSEINDLDVYFHSKDDLIKYSDISDDILYICSSKNLKTEI